MREHSKDFERDREDDVGGMGETYPHARVHEQLQEAGRGMGRFSSVTLGRPQPCPHFSFILLASGTKREHISVV